MFYSIYVLGKKGPLSRVWLAAHWDKKITKTQILETSITESVDSILQPKVKLSLRTSSHLLLGIVRIYSRKTMYLLQDCQDAAFKIKSAFRPGAVDLPPDKTEAAISQINLPDVNDFMIDFDILQEPQISIDLPQQTNLSRSNITLPDQPSAINIDEEFMRDFDSVSRTISKDGMIDIDLDVTINDKDKQNAIDHFNAKIQEDQGIFDIDDGIFGPKPGEQDQHQPQDEDQGPPSVRPGSSMSSNGAFSNGPPSAPVSTPGTPGTPHMELPEPALPIGQTSHVDGPRDYDDSTVGQLILPTLDESQQRRPGPRVRKKRGAIIVDDPKTLSGEEMKNQLSDTSDIVGSLDMAPPTKQLMICKKIGGCEKLFSLPERFMLSERLQYYFTRHCYTKQIDESEEKTRFPQQEPITNGQGEQYEPPYIPGDLPDIEPGIIPKTPQPEIISKRRERDSDKRSPSKRTKSKETKYQESPTKKKHRGESRAEIHENIISEPQTPESPYGDYVDPNTPYVPELERLENETEDIYEDRVRVHRSTILLKFMNDELESRGWVNFNKLVSKNTRKQVAQKFFSILSLKKMQAIEIEQDISTHFGEITITKGSRYSEVLKMIQTN